MNGMKKGQDAFEFLTTYGWMFLIIVVVVGALAFFNYLSVGRFIPESCGFGTGFKCNDFLLTTGAVAVDLENTFADDVVIDSLTVTRPDGSECTIPVSDNLASGEIKQFSIAGCDNGDVDSRFSGNLKVSYSIGSSSFTQLGELTGRIEDGLLTTTIGLSTSTSSTSTTSLTTSTSTTTTTATTTTIGTSYSRALGATAAIDSSYIDQVTPDGGSNDGTVDLDNADVRWLTVDGSNINVTAWNFTLPGMAAVTSVIASCDIHFVNTGGGQLSFSYWDGAAYSSWLCTQTISSVGTYSCNLFATGLDTVSEVNGARLRCRFVDDGPPGSPGFAVDFMMIRVGYTA